MSNNKCCSLLCGNCIGDYLIIKMESGPEVQCRQNDEAAKELISDSNFESKQMQLKTKKTESECSKTALSKHKRNTGQEYVSHTTGKLIRPERRLKSPCGEICKYKCAEKFTEKEREHIFSLYWGLGDIEMQWQFISNCMKIITPKYRYVLTKGERNQRQKNNAFYFRCHDEEIRVCKTFFKNTLDINDRPIRTVLAKRYKIADHLLEPDKRGKHGNHPKLDAKLREGICNFMNTLPRVKKGRNGKSFIETSKSIAALHKEYVTICTENNEPYGNYTNFYRIFNENYTISTKPQTKKVKISK